MMSSAAHEFLDVALQMLAPIIVQPSFHFNFESVAELSSDNLHDRSGPDVSSKFRGDGNLQSLGTTAADDFFFHHDFFERKIFGFFAEQNTSGKFPGGDTGVAWTEAETGQPAALECCADIGEERQMGIARALDRAFVSFNAGIVRGHPEQLDISGGQNLRGLEKLAGTSEGHFLEPDAAFFIDFASDGHFSYRVGFGWIVQRADGAQAGNALQHQVEMT